ncbi:hypothetical protein NUW54_g2418 [Trametes sanguinea]|uniref:Uncharacterized protein n=1 Tax=Trametes sanguinea TaxID=158606 RepID=A0ACC1Q3V0_9APHY|nr:hypothetical protein NUW54_g2418 [Trametes sanguinea]
MDEFFTITVNPADELASSFATSEATSHAPGSFSGLSSHDHSASLAGLASSVPVNGDRIDGYGGYCVIA